MRPVTRVPQIERPAAGGQAVPPRLPTVFHVRASGGLFGADRVVLDLCAELQRTGYRAVLVPLVESDGTGAALSTAAAELRIPVRPLHQSGRFDLRSAAAALRRLAVAEGAVILHGHDYKANVLIHLARAPETYRVATLHGRVGTDWKLRLYEALEAHLVRRFDQVICVSTPMREAETRRGVAPALVANGIDVAPFRDAPAPDPGLKASLGLPASATVIGSIGRLSAEKGFDILLRAAARLAPDHPALHVLLVGEGSEREALAALAASLGLAGRVHLPGVRADTPALYRLFDVFCMPSYREGLPLVLLEALASGAAAVVTPVGGVLDVLGAGEEEGAPVALTFAPGDVPELARLIARLVADPVLRGRLGRAGNERVAAHFSRAAMARATGALYDALRHGGGAPRPPGPGATAAATPGAGT